MTQQEFRKRFRYDPQNDKIASGGFADVYIAEDLLYREKYHPDGSSAGWRKVALKFYKLADEEQYTLAKEVNMAMGLQHPNICRYLERIELERHNIHGTLEIEHVAVLEYLDGGHIDQLVVRFPALLDKFLIDVLSGLACLHREKKIHRDIKPNNVLGCFLKMDAERAYMYEVVPRTYVTTQATVQISNIRNSSFGLWHNARPQMREGEYIIPAVKITDFGISKALDTAPGVSTRVFGSKPYMAPEQINEVTFGVDTKDKKGNPIRGIDTRVDIWSFGVMAYELITGEKLFPGIEGAHSDQEVRRRILGEDIESKINALKPRYRKLLAKCLVRKAEKRCSSCDELIEILKEKDDGGEMPVGGSGGGERMNKVEQEKKNGRYFAYATASSIFALFVALSDEPPTWLLVISHFLLPIFVINLVSFQVSSKSETVDKVFFVVATSILYFIASGAMLAGYDPSIFQHFLLVAISTGAWYIVFMLYKLFIDRKVDKPMAALPALWYTLACNIAIRIFGISTAGGFFGDINGKAVTACVVLWLPLFVFNLLKLKGKSWEYSKSSSEV